MQEFDLSVRRVSNNDAIVSSRPATFEMRGHHGWIHHERADSLLPAYGVQWVLAAGDEELIPMFREAEINIVTVGGEANGYWHIHGAHYRGTFSVDDWR